MLKCDCRMEKLMPFRSLIVTQSSPGLDLPGDLRWNAIPSVVTGLMI